MLGAAVTVIVSTHNRAQVLVRVLRCLLAQTRKDWRALVIGDACTDDTVERVEAIGDPRIRMLNLPAQFGEQAGPNAVGMALAETDYIAFLNHDDFWLPEHLEWALDALEGGAVEMFWGRAAFFQGRGPRLDLAFFNHETERDRSLDTAAERVSSYSDPISAWVLRRDAAERLGAMRLSSEIGGAVPLHDYVMRAARARWRLANGAEFSVLSDRVRERPIPGLRTRAVYDIPLDFTEEWTRRIERGEADAVRAEIEEDLWLARSARLGEPSARRSRADLARWAALYRDTGVDLLRETQVAAPRPSRSMRTFHQRRTGSERPEPQPLDAMIAAARAQLAAAGPWRPSVDAPAQPKAGAA